MVWTNREIDLHFFLLNPKFLVSPSAAPREFLKAQAQFLSVLASLRQSSKHGFRLARDISKQYHTKFAFSTRKGTLEDAIEGLDAGADRIIKKPEPSESELQARSLSAAYDHSFETNRQHVIQGVEDAVRLSTWWWKHKEAVLAYIVGFVSSLGAGYLLHLLSKR
jgi:DNA-binding response OmpR family regulator